MQRRLPNSRLGGGILLLFGLCGLIPVSSRAADPRIDYIELFLSNMVLIHFDTEPNRTYSLQYTETLVGGIPGGNWTNLFVAPNIPSVGHYIIPDTRLRPQRFYRLMATP